MGRPRTDTLHIKAGKELRRMLNLTPANPLPIPVPILDAHLPTNTYYGGNKIYYQMYQGIPQLLTYKLGLLLNLPVDQETVRVSSEGGHLVFFITVPAYQMHSVFRPFILAANKTRPQTKQVTLSSTSALRQLLTCDQIRRATSLVPMENSRDKWVESNMTIQKKVLEVMKAAQKDVTFRIPYNCPLVTSSNTGMSQYLQAPVIRWDRTSAPPTDLHLLLKPEIEQKFCCDEKDARTNANRFWTNLLPFLVTADIIDVIHHTVVAVKVEGKQPLSTLVQGSQEAIKLGTEQLETTFLRAILQAFKIKQRMRKQVLGMLRPYSIQQGLQSSSLLCPGLFPQSAIDQASTLLKEAMDKQTVRAWNGKNPFTAITARKQLFRPPFPTKTVVHSSAGPFKESRGQAPPNQTRKNTNRTYQPGNGPTNSRTNQQQNRQTSTGRGTRQAGRGCFQRSSNHNNPRNSGPRARGRGRQDRPQRGALARTGQENGGKTPTLY